MHLLIPHAAPLADDLGEAVQGLALPTLGRLLRRLRPHTPDVGAEDSLSMPHERALAAALGWPARGDGAFPWAARAAAADGIEVGDRAWGLLTPAHWQLGQKRVSLLDPAALALTDADSRIAFDAVQPLFDAEGWTLAWGAALRWYASHASLADLPCASLDRAVGRPVDAWQVPTPASRPLRRLQAEVQMLLHDHPLNTAREAAGRPTVNSFWLSGAGRLPATAPLIDGEIVVDDRLRTPLLQRDWPQWRDQWSALEAKPLARLLAAAHRGDAVSLTLCGERAAWQHGPAQRGWVERQTGRLHARPIAAWMATL